MDELDLGATIRGFSPGQKLFGRYTLKKQLGRGGMGVVWQARDESLEQDVAIKLLPEMVATDPVSIRELKRETRRSQALAHPHILKVHDFVEGGGLCGISMELVEGGTLSARRLEQAGETFTPAQLGPWVRQLCEALAYAHTKAKVVHRDLKPANLMLTPDGDLKVADFGIAASLSESVTRVSKQAGSSGTPLYMSPQQMMGDDPAVTDDLYALGATLYELLTGKPPFFSGNVMMQVQSKVPVTVNERLRANGHPGEPVPAEWEQTIAACLAKEPKDRPQSAGEVAERLGLSAGPNAQRLTSNAQRSTGSEVERLVPKTLSPAPDNALETTRSTKTPLIGGIAAGIILLAGLGWYFGIHVPEQKRLAEIARLESEKKTEEANRLRIEQEKIAAEARARPQLGQRWVVPDLGIEMIPIAAGSFRMGTDSADDDLGLAKPVTQVTISKPYWLGRTEVTQEQWQALMGANPSKFKAAARPVESITEEQAMAFCEKLTARERAAGRLPAGYIFRLPTEAQWEYACRAGTAGHYAGDADALGWNKNNSGKTTQPVGQKQANAWGLHDMHGNVAEWCIDFKYGEYPGGSVTDFITPGFQGYSRNRRGGSWKDHPVSTASWARAYVADDPSDEFTGLRVALGPEVPPPQPEPQSKPQPEKKSPAVAKISQPQPGQPWENSLGQKFVPVPGTNVLFCIWETRVQDFATFAQATRSEWSKSGKPAHPAVNVSWDDAQAFCAWLTQYDQAAGRLGPDQKYRLPTDAEWSLAVGLTNEGSGTPQSKDSQIKSVYPWGAQWPPPKEAGNYDQSLGVDSFTGTSPVGSFAANRHGIHDLGGNVYEWCDDLYNGSDSPRVLRGASFTINGADFQLSSHRNQDAPDSRNDRIGFRVVVVVGGASSREPASAPTKPDFSVKLPATTASQPTVGTKWTIPELNLDLMPIAPGTFQMGSASGGKDDERPVTRVAITNPFWLGKTEITQAQWSAVMGNNPSKFKGDNLPVEQVNWNDAMEFCRKLTDRERAVGRLPEGHAYSLPTEAQWEYACRAGSTGEFAGNLDAIGWYNLNSGNTTHPVGQKQANGWGLSDMLGNVWEWSADWFNRYPGGSVTDHTGLPSDYGRVCRGGGWGYGAFECRYAYRFGLMPDRSFSLVGFRLALISGR